VNSRRCGPLAAWLSAWQLGQVGPDEVVDAVTCDDARHLVSGLPDAAGELVGLRELIVRWRLDGGGVRAVFPAPGDVRGVPGPSGFLGAAVEAGEAACGAALGAVPEYVDFSPSSAPPTVIWHVYEIEDVPPDYLQLGDVQYELTTAIREAASALAAADVPGWMDEFGPALRNARRAGERLNLPPGYPSRAVALLSQAERLQAVLDVAARDPIGGAHDRTGITTRSEALRPLERAVRRALIAGYNAGGETVASATG